MRPIKRAIGQKKYEQEAKVSQQNKRQEKNIIDYELGSEHSPAGMVSVKSVNSQIFFRTRLAHIGKTSLYDSLINTLTLIQEFICGNLKCYWRDINGK